MRHKTPGHKGIGIHGSTNNESSVPGRGSEGCIRLLNNDLDTLKANYAFVGMKVVVLKDE
jgi:lipoprotein-anchoring transpeptidase ErfK/SrfK